MILIDLNVLLQGLYDKILDQFKALIGNFQPNSAMSDFEKAILNCLKKAFPESRVTGCRFYFGQAGTSNVTILFF